MGHERQVLLPALPDLKRLLGGERLHSRTDRSIQDPVENLEWPPPHIKSLRSAKSWTQPRRMLYSATTSSISNPSLTRCTPCAGGVASNRASAIV